MKTRLIYLIVLLLLAVAAIWFAQRDIGHSKTAQTQATTNSATKEQTKPKSPQDKSKPRPRPVVASAPRYQPPKLTQEDFNRYREWLMVPAAGIINNHDAAVRQQDAMYYLGRDRSLEAVLILAELAMADPKIYFYTGTIKKGYSPSFSVFSELSYSLYDSPLPSEEGPEQNLKNWREWWPKNKDKLRVRPWGEKVPTPDWLKQPPGQDQLPE